jgi:molecular chaperone DnaK
MGTGTGTRPIGIDLGTTFCCAAQVRDGKATVITSRLGYTTLPSIVHYDKSGQVSVGHQAERRMVLAPSQTIYGAKRLLGRTFQSEVRERYQPHFTYELVADNQGMVAAKVCGTVVKLTEVSALILRELRAQVQTALNEKVDRAVVTVPAYFNEGQRACVREAGRMAGLEILRIINEPTAAALCYGLGRGERKHVLVFDLGGGTFDLSLIKIDGDVFEVLAVGGDNFLGGIDFDRKLVELVVKRLSASRPGGFLNLDEVGKERLRAACQEAKHTLSTQQKVTIEVPNFTLGDGQRIEVSVPVTRQEFDQACKPLVDLCMDSVSEVLMDANKMPDELDDILLVGGSTRIPCVVDGLRNMFGKEPSKRVHPDEVVALGAAIAADSHDRIDGAVLTDVLPTAIGLAGPKGRFLPVVARNTSLPHKCVANTEIAPGTTELKLAVFQGESPDVRKNDYLGALVIDGLPGAPQPLKCQLAFVLDAECLLRVFANIPQAQIKREVTLITQHTPDEVLAQLGAERIRIAPPELTTQLKGEAPPAAARKPAAAAQQAEEEEEEEEEERPGFFAWLMGLFGRKAQKNQ